MIKKCYNTSTSEKILAVLKICAHIETYYLDKLETNMNEMKSEELGALKDVPKTYLISKGEEKAVVFLEMPIK